VWGEFETSPAFHPFAFDAGPSLWYRNRMAKVLFVDDEPDMVELITFVFKKSGHQVVIAGDGWEALNKARALRPDIIVLDVMIPEMDGFTVCEILRREPATVNIPILMLTARSGELCRLIGLDSGANDYLTKPFSPRDLETRAQLLLQRH
jgi:DNA-binding response OmpR family regulator